MYAQNKIEAILKTLLNVFNKINDGTQLRIQNKITIYGVTAAVGDHSLWYISQTEWYSVHILNHNFVS